MSPPPNSHRPTAEEVAQIAHQIKIAKYFVVATLTLLIFDYFHTVAEEVKYLWPARRSVMKVAFFLNRYMPFVSTGGFLFAVVLAHPNKVACKTYFTAFGWLVQVNLIISEFILNYRAYAVSGRSRGILALTVLVFMSMLGVTTYFTTLIFKSMKCYEFSIYPRGCIAMPLESYVWDNLIAFIVSETCSLVIVLFRAYRLRGSKLMSVIYRDGIFFYFIIIATFVFTIVLSHSTVITLRNLLIILQATFHSIFCTRMLLHIRAKYHKLSSPMHLTEEMAQIIDIDSFGAGAGSPDTEEASALPVFTPNAISIQEAHRNRSSPESGGSLHLFDDDSIYGGLSSISPSAYMRYDLEDLRSVRPTGSFDSGVLDSDVCSIQIDSEIEEVPVFSAYDERTFDSVSCCQSCIIQEKVAAS